MSRGALVPAEALLAELLRCCGELGRPPTYAELGRVLGGVSRATIHDHMVRLRAAGILRSEPRISLSAHANLQLARILLDLLEPERAARELLRRARVRHLIDLVAAQ